MQWPGFVGPSYISQSPIAANERTVNYYIEQVESGGMTKAALFPTPGVTSVSGGPSSGTGRANFFQNGRHFLIVGAFLYESDVAGILTTRLVTGVADGSLVLDNRPATINGNGDAGGQLFITSGGNGYVYVLATNVCTVIAALVGKATTGGYLGGYFLALNALTSEVYFSSLFDGATWSPGDDFFQRSASADGWNSMIVNQYIYLFGSQSSEVWFNSGAFPIPFELHPSGRLQYGCAAPDSPEVVGTAVVWLGRTPNGQGNVLRTSGFSIEIVSNYATHYAFDSYSVISDAIGDSYEEFGHIFYILTFPTANHTWCFDASNDTWTERSSWNTATMNDDAWRPLFHAFAFDQHRMLDLRGTGVYSLSNSSGQDIGNIDIRRVRRPPTVSKENKRIFYKRIELLLEPGLGLIPGNTSNSPPVVMMRWSDDGGKTWSNESMRSAGSIGQYGARVFWQSCGSGRKRQFEFTMSDPYAWRLLDAYFEATPGGN